MNWGFGWKTPQARTLQISILKGNYDQAIMVGELTKSDLFVTFLMNHCGEQMYNLYSVIGDNYLEI